MSEKYPNPSLESEAADHNGAYVNDILIDTICERLASFHADLDYELNKSVLDIPSIKREIVDCFPLPIGEQLRKLFTRSKNPSEPDEMERFTQNRFKHILDTYRCTVQFIAYILLSQLWDEKYSNPGFVIEPSLKDKINALFSHDSQSIFKYDYVQLIIEITDHFDKQKVQYFIRELNDLKIQARENSILNEAYNFFVEWINKIQDTPVPEDKIKSLCLTGEENLGVILNEFAFLIQYKLVTIKNIEIIKERHADARYKHRQIQLNRALTVANTGLSEVGVELDNFTDNKCVLFFKLKDKVIETYLSLSPFIIDQNAFTRDRSSKLYLFSWQKEHQYHFQFLNNLSDRTCIIDDSNFADVNADFTKFKQVVLGISIQKMDSQQTQRRSRFLRKK